MGGGSAYPENGKNLRIQSKSIRDLGTKPPRTGALAEQSPPNIIFFAPTFSLRSFGIRFRRFWAKKMSLEKSGQDSNFFGRLKKLKIVNKIINTKNKYCENQKIYFWLVSEHWATISTKKWRLLFFRGGWVWISFTRTRAIHSYCEKFILR